MKSRKHSVQAGDAVLVNGDLGRPGMAILSAREGLGFESPIESDSACVAGAVLDLLKAGLEIHCLRDCTRGGLASVLNEVAETADRAIHVEEGRIPVSEAVRAACELFGLDPLHVACEGRFAAFVRADRSAKALEILNKAQSSTEPRQIGTVSVERRPRVLLISKIGVPRILDMASGEQLPRIC